MDKEKKMTWEGIGPKLALITLLYTILAIIVIHRFPEFLKLNFLNITFARIAGYLLLVIGLVFYIYAAKVFFADFKKGKLITRGPFGLCRNPIYASFIVFVVPALALLFQSGMILSIDVVLYIIFKILIHAEYDLLKANFGDEFDKYAKSVNEIFPFPRFWKKPL